MEFTYPSHKGQLLTFNGIQWSPRALYLLELVMLKLQQHVDGRSLADINLGLGVKGEVLAGNLVRVNVVHVTELLRTSNVISEHN